MNQVIALTVFVSLAFLNSVAHADGFECAALLDTEKYPANQPITIFYSASLNGAKPTEARQTLPDLAERVAQFKQLENGSASAYFIEDHNDGQLKFILRGLPANQMQVAQSPELTNSRPIDSISPEVQAKIPELDLLWQLVNEKDKGPGRIQAYLNLFPADPATKRRVVDSSVFKQTYPGLQGLLIKYESQIEFKEYDAKRDVVEIIAPAEVILALAADFQIINVMRWR